MILMPPLVSMLCFLVFAAVSLPITTAYVDCRIACLRCRENQEHEVLLEVHCAMCEECKLRRKELIYGARVLPQQNNIDTVAVPRVTAARQRVARTEPSPAPYNKYDIKIENLPEDCPTPPPCGSNEESVPIKLKSESTTTTTTSTTTTTEKPPCPAVICNKRATATPKSTTAGCVPCMPFCVSPCQFQMLQMPLAIAPAALPTLASATRVTVPLKATTRADYYYVYLGIPKGSIRTS